MAWPDEREPRHRMQLRHGSVLNRLPGSLLAVFHRRAEGAHQHNAALPQYQDWTCVVALPTYIWRGCIISIFFLPLLFLSVVCPAGPHPPLRLARRPNRGHTHSRGSRTPSCIIINARHMLPSPVGTFFLQSPGIPSYSNVCNNASQRCHAET